MGKKQNGDCNVRNFKLLLFDMSPGVPAFIVRVLIVTLSFELELMNISSRHYHSILFMYLFIF